jgi:hypothetical protein
MNTTVLLTEPLDLGAGAADRVTFPSCRWHADEGGSLHIIREGGRGTAISFGPGAWVYVSDGGGIAATEAKR